MTLDDTAPPTDVVFTPPAKRPRKPLATEQEIINAPPLAQLNLGDVLYICVNKNGKKRTYKFRSYFNDKTSWVIIGQYPDLTILGARKLVETIYRTNIDKARQNKSHLGWEISLKNFKPKVKSDSEKFPSFRSMMDSTEFIRNLYANMNESETRQAIWLQMLVPWRSTELLTARWADFDLERRVWIVNNMKISKSANTKSNHLQIEYISNAAYNAITKLPSNLNGEYLFPSLCANNTSAAGRNKIITKEIENIWNKYPIKPEYFKNFFITTASRDSHFKPEFIRAMANHKSKENPFTRFWDEQHKRTLTEWWAQTLLQLAEVKSTNQSPGPGGINRAI